MGLFDWLTQKTKSLSEMSRAELRKQELLLQRDRDQLIKRISQLADQKQKIFEKGKIEKSPEVRRVMAQEFDLRTTEQMMASRQLNIRSKEALTVSRLRMLKENAERAARAGSKLGIVSAGIVKVRKGYETGVGSTFGADRSQPKANGFTKHFFVDGYPVPTGLTWFCWQQFNPTAYGMHVFGRRFGAPKSFPENVEWHLPGNHLLIERRCIGGAGFNQRGVSGNALQVKDICYSAICCGSAHKLASFMASCAVSFEDMARANIRVLKPSRQCRNRNGISRG